jgi:hypothetical protein
MTAAPPELGPDFARKQSPLPGRAVLIVAAGTVAAWMMAGSGGWLAPSLGKAIAWLALGAAIIATKKGSELFSTKTVLTPFVLVAGLMMTASASAVVNVLAVALVLATLAYLQHGLVRRAVLIVATAVTVFALYRLAVESTALVGLAAESLGQAMGQFVGWASGRPLLIGASFGGTDFLVLMAALYAGWLAGIVPLSKAGEAGRIRKSILLPAMLAAVAIAAAQFAYLLVLAFTCDMTSALPPVVEPTFTGVSRMGVWTWGNALHSLLPWNLPLVAVLLHTLIAAAMFHWANWRPVAEPLPTEVPSVGEKSNAVRGADRTPAPQSRRKKKVWKDESQSESPPLDGRAVARSLLMHLLPGVLAIVVVTSMLLVVGKPDLSGRRVLLCAPKGATHEHGLLRSLIASLGGSCTQSATIAEDRLSQADVLLLTRPDLSPDQQQRIWAFVRGGGSLLIAAGTEAQGGASRNALSAVLEPTAIRLGETAATSVTEHWEDNLLTVPHQATIGLNAGHNPLGLVRPGALKVAWPARPLALGRWAWSKPKEGTAPDAPPQYASGDRLGDLVLAAEERVGQGRVVVLADASCLGDELLPGSHEFTSRLLGALAAKVGCPQLFLRQVLSLVAIAALIAVLAWRAEAARLAANVAVLALAITACQTVGNVRAGLFPQERPDASHTGGPTSDVRVAYIDGSHLPAFSDDPSLPDGLGRFTRILAENGYLPLIAPDVSRDRLRHASLLISIAPSRQFSPAERAAVKEFVEGGGTFIAMAGAPEAAAGASLLAVFGLNVPPTPVPPSEVTRETVPIRNFNGKTDAEQMHFMTLDEKAAAYFFACWPVEGGKESDTLLAWPVRESRIVVSQRLGKGTATVMGDTGFAMNKNLDAGQLPENTRFWQWLLVRLTGQGEFSPSPKPKPQLDEPPEGGPLEPK